MPEKTRKLKVDMAFYKDRGEYAQFYNEAEASKEPDPVPEGEYNAIVKDGELFKARTGTMGYKVTFEIASGPYRGRKIPFNAWLTVDATSRSKYYLKKLGFHRLQDLDSPIRQGVRAGIYVIVRGAGRRMYSEVDDFDILTPESERTQRKPTMDPNAGLPRDPMDEEIDRF